MGKFEVGDYVVAAGKLADRYSITNKKRKVPMTVVGYHRDGKLIEVRVNDGHHIGNSFWVDPTLFKKAKQAISDTQLLKQLNEYLESELFAPRYKPEGFGYTVHFEESGLTIGCQHLKKSEAIALANKVLRHYGSDV